MTKVVFYKQHGVFYGFHEIGHAGYGEFGTDIICSALSAMTMLIVNTVETVWGCDVSYKIDDETTDIEVICKGALPKYETNQSKNYAISALLQGYFLQLNDMLEDYYDYLEVEEKERDI